MGLQLAQFVLIRGFIRDIIRVLVQQFLCSFWRNRFDVNSQVLVPFVTGAHKAPPRSRLDQIHPAFAVSSASQESAATILPPFVSWVGSWYLPGRDEVLMLSTAQSHFNINPVARQDSHQFAHRVKGVLRSVKGIEQFFGCVQLSPPLSGPRLGPHIAIALCRLPCLDPTGFLPETRRMCPHRLAYRQKELWELT